MTDNIILSPRAWKEYIEVRGQIIFDTKNLTKEEIFIDLHPHIVSARIITEQRVELNQRGDFAPR